MSKFNAGSILSLLRNARIHVVFTKVDGSERDMFCTLLEPYLPGLTGSSESNAQSDDAIDITVWDIDKHSWRSIKISSVKSVRVGAINFSPGKSTLQG